jgi:hypothetical protein
MLGWPSRLDGTPAANHLSAHSGARHGRTVGSAPGPCNYSVSRRRWAPLGRAGEDAQVPKISRHECRSATTFDHWWTTCVWAVRRGVSEHALTDPSKSAASSFFRRCLRFVDGLENTAILAFNRIASQDALSVALELQAARDSPSALRYPPKSWRLRARPYSERHYYEPCRKMNKGKKGARRRPPSALDEGCIRHDCWENSRPAVRRAKCSAASSRRESRG